LEVLGNAMCDERKEEIIDCATMKEDIRHPRTEIFGYDISQKDMKTLMEV